MIWGALRERGVREQDSATWPPLAHIDSLSGGPFTAAATSPALTAAYDELIGAGRWTPPVNAGGAIAVRFPSEDRANAGYHIEGSYDGPGGYWANIRSRARGLLALLLFTDIGPDDAPTRLVCGSHLYVPEFLAPYGEAGTSSDGEFWRPFGPVQAGDARDRTGGGRLLVPSILGPHRDLAAPGNRATDDRPASRAPPRRVHARRQRSFTSSPDHHGRAGGN
ncbi:MAG TPA: hypothetical protein VEH31_18810 [Streptosporangiaceae bacterium]|nr:hypothetical protein [Streptosporangiaceae bacterium]